MRTVKKRKYRGSAAAFAVGLFLAVPQAAVAAAESGGDSVDGAQASRGAGDAGSAAAKGPARRGAVQSIGKAAEGSARAGRSAQSRPALTAAARATASLPAVRPVPRPGVDQSVRQPAARVVAAQAPAAVAAATSTGVVAPMPVRAALAVAGRGEPTASAAAAPAVSVRDRVVAEERKFFNRVANWLNELPDGDFTSALEGALLMVRRNFFNLAPSVTPTPQDTLSDGTIRGRVGAIDAEGDKLTYRLIAGPPLGTVEVLADGRYVYAPGPDFNGTDSFTVKVAPENRSVNLLDLGGDGSREATIDIGGDGSKVDFTDLAVYLPNASGHISVVKSGLFGSRFTATITLPATYSDQQFSWMDNVGHRGQISLERLATVKWPVFLAVADENGASVNLTLSYTGSDGVQQAALLNNAAVSKDASGQYVFTGQLAPNPDLRPNSVDQWDVVGAAYKPLYESFRKAYNIEKGQTGKFTTVDFDFTDAAMFAYTYTPLSYRQAGLYGLDSEANPHAANPPGGAAIPEAQSPLQAAATVAATGVTASIPLGRSFAVGRNDGSVELWTDGQKQLLHDSGWGQPVRYLLDYRRPLKDAQGATVASSFTGYISGTTLTVTALGAGSTVVVGSEITGAGVKPGTVITKAVPLTGSAGGPGTYEVSISQKVGSAVAPVSQEDPSKTLPAGVEFTQKNVAATAHGLVAGLANGAVQLWTASGGWTELHDSGWNAGVTSMITYGEGFVVGLDNGSVQKWNGPGANPDQSSWKNNWISLQGDGWKSAVTVLKPYKGRPDVCTGGCDGFLVGLASGSVQQFNEAKDGAGKPGWWELQGAGWGSAVKGFVLSKKDSAGLPTFAVGLQNGAVEQWNGNGWTEIQKPGRDGWNTEITAMSQFGDNFIVGLKNGAVFNRVNSGNYWIQLHDAGWNSPVNQIVPFNSATVGNGVVVGLDNGSVQVWKGKTAGTNPDSGQNYWTELHDSGWASGIASIVPARSTVTNANGDVVLQDGVVVGLKNGALEQWSGLITGSTGQNDWTEVDGPQVNQAAKYMGQDGFLKSAVDFGLALADTGEAPVWGAAGSVGGAGDPLFSQAIFQKASNATGTYLPVVSYIPASLIHKTLEDPKGLTDSTVDLSYDVNALAYGYAFVPDGVGDKMAPGKWSMAVLIGLQTGPSLTLNFSKPGTITVGDSNLFNYQYWTPGPLGFDLFAIDVGADAGLDVTLNGAEDKDSLNAHAYMVPGMLFTYNTKSKPKGVQLGFSAYPDIDASDFTSLTGITVTPTLTPYVTASYGIMAPNTTPLIGGWSLFKISLGYENPVSASLCADFTSQCPTATADTGSKLSLTLDSQGYITASAGILDGITDALTWRGEYQVYDVSRTFPL